jgi:hypothetical protein
MFRKARSTFFLVLMAAGCTCKSNPPSAYRTQVTTRPSTRPNSGRPIGTPATYPSLTIARDPITSTASESPIEILPVDPIDGKANFSAIQTQPTIFAVKLPHGTDRATIIEIDVWANTDKVEGKRINADNYRCDEVQLVEDHPTHTPISVGRMFGGILNGVINGTVETTNGSAVGDGDTFTLKATDADPSAFNALADEASRGTIFIKLVRKQPDPITQIVLSAKVKIVVQ